MGDVVPPTGDQKKHYFVDEAGDPVLFNGRKQIVVGQEGCSTFFMLGLLDVAAPDALGLELAELRQRVIGDPYFKSVPSMQAARKKDGGRVPREGRHSGDSTRGILSADAP